MRQWQSKQHQVRLRHFVLEILDQLKLIRRLCNFWPLHLLIGRITAGVTLNELGALFTHASYVADATEKHRQLCRLLSAFAIENYGISKRQVFTFCFQEIYKMEKILETHCMGELTNEQTRQLVDKCDWYRTQKSSCLNH